MLWFTDAASERRENLTVRTSRDGGKSWSAWRVLHAGPAAYSTVVALRDGSIAVLYERGEKHAVERVTFVRFAAEWGMGR
ncbi:MAG: exo-alpha-sialidase [Acidobacteria bacterium]|nr:exo-alpha-sialidase [Acidobacteriota bacterium]